MTEELPPANTRLLAATADNRTPLLDSVTAELRDGKVASPVIRGWVRTSHHVSSSMA